MKGFLFQMQKLLTKVTAPSLIGRAGGESALFTLHSSFLSSHFSFLIFNFSFLIIFFLPLTLSAQSIGGNVYGGGNSGDVVGNATVTVKAGDLNKVFGGARMANVGGHAFVNINGKEATDSMVINYVFGGNDIAGTIGSSIVPLELTGAEENQVKNSWNTFVRISTETDAQGKELEEAKKIYIGQLFAGGNGEYDREVVTTGEGDDAVTTYYIKDKKSGAVIATSTTDFTPPEVDKAYLEVCGGSIVYAYGGGNNATVKDSTVIMVDNPSKVVNSILDDEGNELLTDERFLAMGINTGFSYPSSDAFQIGRFFGGNNEAEMSIRPVWNLKSGKIRNLYSGGNQGAMTHREGLLLEIPATSKIKVDNVYGGCRMADVRPLVSGTLKSGVFSESVASEIQLTDKDANGDPKYKFPAGLAARVLIRGGDINNVYGGNDVTGKVYGGNAIGIYTSIRGDVFGGGNGSYPYTDNPQLIGDNIYGDLYYPFPNPEIPFASSVEAMNAFRPNSEQVSIRLKGEPDKPTIIRGSVYLGGNSATIMTDKTDPMVHLKMGSYVIADTVFLGNNGANMVLTNAKDVNHHVEGVLRTMKSTDKTGNGSVFSSLDLTDEETFASYMEGAAMSLKPKLIFDSKLENGDPDDYIPYTSYIGSFYCGGNVGSMTYEDKNIMELSAPVVAFDKIVGGCNNANVKESEYNAAYEGGLIGSKEEQASYTDANGKIKDRLTLNFSGIRIEPRRWAQDDNGDELLDAHGNPYLVWNTVKWSDAEDDFLPIGTDNAADDEDRRLFGGNVYGGCYSSGHVNGNVEININKDVIKREEMFAEADEEDPYAMKEGGERRSGVLLESQGDDVMSVAMTVFGAGMGEGTEVWGSTTVNLNEGYAFQVFGGGEEGVVGKKNDAGDYEYNPAYSTTVNLNGKNVGYSEDEDGPALAETEYIYGAGNEGDVCGDAYVNLGSGRIYDAFGGASNADILGHTEVHIGRDGDGQPGFPWVRDNVYGGNDFGGTIHGSKDFASVTNRVLEEESVARMNASTYVKYIQGRVDSIFGGNYGSYDYVDRLYQDYTDDDGAPKEGFSFPHINHNSFVHFQPANNVNNTVGLIFGSSEGYPGNSDLNNTMQELSYVLIDDDQTTDPNRFINTDIYGGGAYAGVGIYGNPGAGNTFVDLYAGRFHNVYGGSNNEGLIGYTHVNVPESSAVHVNAIFGGGKGYDPVENPELSDRYCDNYVTCIDFKGKNAIVDDALYGGNQNSRISCDTYINVEAPVNQGNGYQATVYGAGYGTETVSGRTNIFMNNGSNAYKVFGGGRDGNAMNYASLTQWLTNQFLSGGTPAEEVPAKLTGYGNILRAFATYVNNHPIKLPSNIGTYVNAATQKYDGTFTNDIMPSEQKPNPDYHNTNVHIMEGGNVSGYAYGGGFGEDAIVSGTTYIELKGGNVDKDIYGGGQGGSVFDEYGLKTFTASTNVFVEGGMARNVYGGGYLGHVGKHDGDISDSNAGDIPAVANVTIGTLDGTTFLKGLPAIQRNAYGGGEGGSVYGTSYVTMNNGYIGYRYQNVGTAEAPDYQYMPEVTDWGKKTKNGLFMPNHDLEDAGCIFGGGYVVNSYVDNTHINMYNGLVRGSIFGGGEIGPIGRGTMKANATIANGGLKNGAATIYKAGQTHIKMYDGQVLRNVYGGGRGKDNWGGDGTMYMDKDLVATLDLNCKGFIFGQTDVNIHGGTIGTTDGMALGDSIGSVFGGGDEGYVYSAYEYPDGTLGVGTKKGQRYDDGDEGYYYWSRGEGNFTDKAGAALPPGGEKFMTEDCHVLVEPHCRVLSPFILDSHPYTVGEYVPTSVLNKLRNKTADANIWENLDTKGIIVHNAVFAGGNVPLGSTQLNANDYTVMGNATASIHDIYHRDLITIGTGHTGGLYGDGNLTLVDGYRGLNITNYGTDFYHISDEIGIDAYHQLTDREAAYYELKYRCEKSCTDNEGNTYSVGSTVAHDELVALFAGVKDGGVSIINSDGTPNETYWTENGVVSRYAGRIMNTIQRADFCGVWGSRMVMQGAEDRVRETADFTNYTINRVREVSLNKKESLIASDREQNVDGSFKNPNDALHGNYFGIYNKVNCLGALTSDVDFYDNVRVTDNADGEIYKADYELNNHTYHYGDADATWASWKEKHHNDRTRNNGTSHNKVALASGVYLELTSEESTGDGLYEKDWGIITGVVELDLINVQKGIGGGFVYAKNVHGVRQPSGLKNVTLTDLNKGAVTNKQWTYKPAEDSNSWQSSGNFVHSTQTIIDDCYDISAKFSGANPVPAHYWFIKGQIYVYDQYLSAYTGAPNAYSETVKIPLTITAASHGTMKLLNVKPSRYAFYSINNATTQKRLEGEQKLVIRDATYNLNDPISYWDWSLLSASERNLFVENTFVSIADCKIGDTDYPEGTVLLPEEFEALRSSAPEKVLDDEGDDAVPSVFHVEKKKDVAFDEVFRPSNNLGHDTGYLLTYDVNNPSVWNKYYTPVTGVSQDEKIDATTYDELTRAEQDNYYAGPTFKPVHSGVYGQRDYVVSDIITQSVQDTYQQVKTHLGDTQLAGQAAFEEAYLVTEYVEAVNKQGAEQHFQVGARLAKSEYTDAQWALLSGSVAKAYISDRSIPLADNDFIYNGQLMTKAEMDAYKLDNPTHAAEIQEHVVPAYYCTTAGRYGGDYYETGKNYRALTAWCAMSDEDRENFTFNYDALDLFVDPTYGKSEGQKYQYDGHPDFNPATATQAQKDKMIYSLNRPVDYTATYNGVSDATPHNGVLLVHDKEYGREEFEKLPNEQHHYAPITVKEPGTYYVVNSPFMVGEAPFAVGNLVTYETYEGLTDDIRANITPIHFDEEDIDGDGSTYYFCRNSYKIGHNGEGVGVTGYKGVGGSYAVGETVPVGLVLNENSYRQLVNRQLNFTIHGIAPMETSTLYVSRNSDIFDLSKDKILSVIYQYDYEESDEAGMHITPVTERHILNIHLQFKSGIPTLDNISEPSTVLPGNSLSLRVPTVTPGAYEVLGGGWELFEKETDAESHTNGIPYKPNADSLYWYQDGYYVAYYAKTYLGKTFSNHVPVSVANYHDLKAVMDDKQHHLHVDYDVNRLKRESKIYVNDYRGSNENGLGLLRSFYDLSLIDKNTPGINLSGDFINADGHPLKGHHLLNDHVRGGEDLEFILRADLEQQKDAAGNYLPWTPMGSGTEACFAGNVHGDGHTVRGLDNSLFGKFCGNVYNLGVTGSFTSAGVADTGTGYVENTWISTTGNPDGSVYPVFGNPTATGSIKQVVNSYYPATKNYKTDANVHGLATAKPERAFYNGEVAYDLNGFYLYKRYSDQKVTSGTPYLFYDGTGTQLSAPQEKHYGSNPALCSTGYNGISYVEDRYGDGDFIYAGGEVPSTVDERLYIDENTGDLSYYPIWPDDYLFFGQKLTYGYTTQAHDSEPSSIVKSEGRLPRNSQSNRVYRAPAYFGNSTTGVAHFNPWAFLAAKENNGTREAYPGMTAIDFKGHQDSDYALGTSGNNFYPPLLDDAGLVGIANSGETQNLLVYAGDNETTNAVLGAYFIDPSYNDYSDKLTSGNAQYDDNKEYGRVSTAPASSVMGHLVTSDLKAATDHFLVDKQDFNAPFAYSFLNPNANGDGGTRMWYQRQPDNYVDRNKGWEGVSLPFAVSTVSASKNGEITHFYKESTSGHEYWLREFQGTEPGGTAEIVKAKMDVLDKTSGNSKYYNNTFLWDYFYNENGQQDKNRDIYQTYYKSGHTYSGYPYYQAATPYIVGFPGATYYEFDLSGDWTPSNTVRDVTWTSSHKQQMITFASPEGTTIGVSDNEMNGVKKGNYTFKPNYATKTFEAGTPNTFTLNADGDRYEKVPAAGDDAVTVQAFRPYFVTAGGGDVKGTRSIVFTSVNDGKIEPQEIDNRGALIVRGRKHNIVVTSTKPEPTTVTIVNAAGMTITTYEIQPGETIETNVISGVYIVNQKKVAIE